MQTGVNPIERFNFLWGQVTGIFTDFPVSVHCFYGESTHFEAARGCAVTRISGSTIELVLAHKMKDLAEPNIEAILRHEIGHMIDWLLDSEFLNGLAASRGVSLPSTLERRADAIAELVWGDAIFYDGRMIQILGSGTKPRPENLGL